MRKKTKNKGLSLVELLVATVISLLIIAAGTTFWMQQNKVTAKVIKKTYAESVIFQIAEIISSDLRKAGYGNATDPIVWDNSTKILSIKYVDYERSGCANETYGNNSCSFLIKYKQENDSLKREQNGSGFQAMNDPQVVKITKFDVDIDIINKTVEFKIEATAELGSFAITNKVKCRNWK
ncbi:PilW family protein [Thermodesulfatator autotrophicus]|uniref:Uncharacterized protein n=1 Tax=Thermodesulfatator autotrophicus TaxID=1795632 RepID=A0A177E7L0_9BACT|nr:prepilin-type N-terminal cleavage/methylation domain-containing protein [Thermodesulfatator autotrophicus]OAG27696.1 hypothetical protein TH606_05735 [Thermodesulfatator autotrophicus]